MSIDDAARDLGKLLQVLHVDACFVGPSGCSFRHAFDSIDKACQSSDDAICMAYCRPGDTSMLKLDRVRESFGFGVAHGHVVRAVVVSRREKVMPLLRVEIPGFAIARFDMNVARAAHRGQWHSIIIEIAVEMRVGRHSWCRMRLSEEIERSLGLWKQSVPQ